MSDHVLDMRRGASGDLAALLSERSGLAARIDDQVADIVEDVRKRGDQALIELTRRFDGFEATAQNLVMDREAIEQAADGVPEREIEALRTAAGRIQEYHERQLPEDRDWTDSVGAFLGWRWSAVHSAGLYAPGGSASYPSSVLMNAIPARLAGVSEIAIAAPTPGGSTNPLLMMAAQLADIEKVYRIGGAQAIAAMAFGTGLVDKVDKIAGPGNAYVAAAKRQLYGTVGIDMIAGPSEVVIISDSTGNPSWIAADLLAQAEHDEDAQSVLITTCPEVAEQTRKSVTHQLEYMERNAIASSSWYKHGRILLVRDLQQAADIANEIAPEHLQLCVSDPGRLAEVVTNAGAIFLGEWTPEVVGDYVAGPNHVLPTYGAARFSSGLSVLDFMKRTSIVGLSRDAFQRIGPDAEILANAEGLPGHAMAIRCRLGRNQGDEQ